MSQPQNRTEEFVRSPHHETAVFDLIPEQTRRVEAIASFEGKTESEVVSEAISLLYNTKTDRES